MWDFNNFSITHAGKALSLSLSLFLVRSLVLVLLSSPNVVFVVASSFSFRVNHVMLIIPRKTISRNCHVGLLNFLPSSVSNSTSDNCMAHK